MKVRRLKLLEFATVAGAIAAFAVGGHFAATAVIGHQRFKQVRELTDVALRRAEVAIDFGALTLGEVARRGPMDCDASTLQALRLQVYQRSAVKDIRSLNRDGSVNCSAYSETLEFDNGIVARGDLQPARDSGLYLFRMEQINGFALGLLRDTDASKSLVAILGITSSVFDIMPAYLRASSEVLLDLNGGANVGRFATREVDPATAFTYSQDSTQYPLRATIRIDDKAFARWDTEAYWPIMLLAGWLGLAFGVLLARATARNDGPVADLDRGLALRQFKPFYQPIFDLHSGAILGCEALARWVRADGSVTPPMSFIPLAEASGRIEKMTWQILATALHELQPRMKADRHFKLSINIVPRHLLSDCFVASLRRVVSDARVSPRQIVLEVTERDELPDLKQAAAVVAQLRELGFRVAMDDVGVGHSGLSQMKRLGANTIKIDKFFVDTITGDSAAVTIVEMLVRLARELKMTVVAEGIESADQISALLACGVTEGQGYIVSPPLPFAKFDALVEARTAAAETEAAMHAAALVA